MQVLQILKRKGDDGVITVLPEDTLADVSQVLSSRKIGAVVVSSDGKHIDGIVSERDIVRELGRKGAACLSLPVKTFMSKKISTCTRKTTTVEVLEMMSAGNFRHMPVVAEDEMIGLISIRDVASTRVEELHMEKEALTGMIMGN
ncbi:CBS domain-containing protein [Rhodobacteraceae bacterium]|nr:CBS domain-containing protein [Paracoccaceae bacterium]